MFEPLDLFKRSIMFQIDNTEIMKFAFFSPFVLKPLKRKNVLFVPCNESLDGVCSSSPSLDSTPVIKPQRHPLTMFLSSHCFRLSPSCHHRKLQPANHNQQTKPGEHDKDCLDHLGVLHKDTVGSRACFSLANCGSGVLDKNL